MIPDQLYGPLGALTVLAFVVVGFIRGDIVPGFFYRRERDARDRSDKILESIADLVKAALDRDRGNG